MKPIFRKVTMVYLILLGVTLGAALYAGVVVAPVTFHSEQWLGAPLLSRYQEGLIMTQNFVRLHYVVDATVVAILLYEGYKFKMFERDKLTLAAAFVAVATGLMFGHYYIPDIITMQLGGEAMTQSQTFANVHKGSEINMKLFVAALLLLMVQNMRKACR